jgi:integrase
MPSDPTRHITSFKTAWKTTRKNAKVTGRWHDNRHTLITELAESGAGDETIMEIAGHVDRQMLRHYSHIRMAALMVSGMVRFAESMVTQAHGL